MIEEMLTPNELRTLTYGDVIDTMDESQKFVLYDLVGEALRFKNKHEEEIQEGAMIFTCPNCGKYYIHNGSGFVPNCENCSSILRRI